MTPSVYSNESVKLPVCSNNSLHNSILAKRKSTCVYLNLILIIKENLTLMFLLARKQLPISSSKIKNNYQLNWPKNYAYYITHVIIIKHFVTYQSHHIYVFSAYNSQKFIITSRSSHFAYACFVTVKKKKVK